MESLKSLKLLNRIKENRARLDLTQEQLAQRVGISRVTLGTIESGSRKVDLLTAFKISIVLGASVPDIFYSESQN